MRVHHFWMLFWHWHWQNLAKKDGKGGLNGRAWLHLYWGNPDIHGEGRKLTCFYAAPVCSPSRVR